MFNARLLALTVLALVTACVGSDRASASAQQDVAVEGDIEQTTSQTSADAPGEEIVHGANTDVVTSAGDGAGGAPAAIRFAMIGDYGDDNANAAAVAKLVDSAKPDFVITLGDNNYNAGEVETIDQNIGKQYGGFIKPYQGKYGAGSADINRFWPSLGNHDWYAKDAPKAYTDYFQLPHVERYYDFVVGPLHMVAIDSDTKEPHGVDADSKQAKWVKQRLAASVSPFRFVYFHHPPRNSGKHGPTLHMRWPWRQLGVDGVFAGHDHSYERILHDGVWHLVNGIGGRALYEAGTKIDQGSQVRCYGRYGAVIVDATDQLARFRTLDTEGNVLDEFGVAARGAARDVSAATQLLAFGSTWQYRDDGVEEPGWKQRNGGSHWKTGQAPLGYGDKVKTTVSWGKDAKKKHRTTYFRRAFSVEEPAKFKYLRLHVRRDDGAVVFLNGQEAWRSNMPVGKIAASTPASYTISGAAEDTLVHTVLLASGLQQGENVIAAELHQVSDSSSDLAFDLALWAFQSGK